MYRRVGRICTGAIEGNARWLKEWLDWWDESAPAKMREIGFNYLHSRFYKGMGWEIEKKDFPNVQKFVRNCHANGVKALAYVQFGTLYPELMRKEIPDMVLLDLGLGGSTTVGIDICRQLRERYSALKILIFTGEILNERLWIEALSAGADGIILKTGNLLQRDDVQMVMHGRKMVFNEPILEKIMVRYRKSVLSEVHHSDALIDYDIDEYDERYLRHLALGYTKDMIANLKGMPFGAKSLEKRQVDLINRLFPGSERTGVNATRLVTRALQLHILDLENLKPDEE
jgi:DNA-binding NarL/FixJ family response regulator